MKKDNALPYFKYKERLQMEPNHTLNLVEEKLFNKHGITYLSSKYELHCIKTLGHTLAIALRRVLLSDLHGVAPVAMSIKTNHYKATHVFDALSGVKETVFEISMNLRNLFIKFMNDEEFTILSLQASGSGKVFAKDFVGDNVTIINKDLYICTLDANTTLNLEIAIGKGFGFLEAENHEFSPELPESFFSIDSYFSPVLHFEYTVYAEHKDLDYLHFTIQSKGTVDTEELLRESGNLLHKYFNVIGGNSIKDKDEEEKEEVTDQLLYVEIKDLDGLSLRTKNAILRKPNLQILNDLLQHTFEEIKQWDGIGDVALDELKRFLSDYNLSFRKE